MQGWSDSDAELSRKTIHWFRDSFLSSTFRASIYKVHNIWRHLDPPSKFQLMSVKLQKGSIPRVSRGVGPYFLLVRTSSVHAPLSIWHSVTHNDVRCSLLACSHPSHHLLPSFHVPSPPASRWPTFSDGEKVERGGRGSGGKGVESFSLLFPPFFHQFRRGS